MVARDTPNYKYKFGVKMKHCSTCKVEKSLVDFHRRTNSPDGRVGICKQCHKQVNSRHYINNKQLYIARATTQRAQNLELFHNWKATLCCACCGESTAECLDFHHLDPSQKETTVASLVTGFGGNKWNQEVEKCVVLCANCHRKVHANLISLIKVP